MIIALPNGRIVTFKEMVPVVEKRYVFNGKRRVMSEVVERNDIQPNALRFYYDVPITTSMVSNNALRAGITIGNIQPNVLRDIIGEIKITDKFDFSNMLFQVKKEAFNYIIDDENSSSNSGLYIYSNDELYDMTSKVVSIDGSFADYNENEEDYKDYDNHPL